MKKCSEGDHTIKGSCYVMKSIEKEDFGRVFYVCKKHIERYQKLPVKKS